MINHARTLLANLSAGHRVGFGEEYIDPGFRPLAMPHAVAQARRVLFGPTPDRWMVNYRCAQLMAFVHATPLEGLAMALDPRVTYLTLGGPGPMADPATYIPVVMPVGTVTVVGRPEVPDKTGVMRHLYEIERTDSDSVAVARLSPPTSRQVYSYEIASGASGPVPLAGSGYSFKVLSSTPEAPFSIEILNRPAADVGGLVSSFARMGDASAPSLFRLGKGHPYDKLYEVWRKEKETPLLVAALTLAVVYRSEEVRKGG